jgi:hypothetical protein
MISERAEKRLLLISSIITALVAILGGTTDFLKKAIALVTDINELPSFAFWLAYIGLFILAAFLLYRWHTRHSLLLKPEALRLDRNNAQQLVGRAEDIETLYQQCLANQIVFLEGESGSGKSALVRAGLLPRLREEKSILPLMLIDLWVEQWERGPLQALRTAMIQNDIIDLDQSNYQEAPQQDPTSLSLNFSLEEALKKESDRGRTALVIFDQFDDYQARNRERFLPKSTWLDPASLRRENSFWALMAKLLENDKVRCLFITRSDAAAGLSSVQFLGPVQALRIDRIPEQYITELLNRITAGDTQSPVISNPEDGWYRLRDQIVMDIARQGVILPQQLKVVLGGLQNLRRLSVADYSRAGGAAGLEALYVEQQIQGTARKIGLETQQIRALLVALIDPENSTKTRSRSKEQLAAAITPTPKTGSIDARVVDLSLSELERGEMIRSASDPISGELAYQLDHDYLTRGVAAAERRANKWQYILSDCSRAYESAGSLIKRWKTLLPAPLQCRLAWERLRGALHYGEHRDYALVSLIKVLPIIAVIGITSFVAYKNYSERIYNLANDSAGRIWRKFDFQNGISAQDLDGAWTLASTNDNLVRVTFMTQLLGSPEYSLRFLRQPELLGKALVGINPAVREALGKVDVPPLHGQDLDIALTAAAAAISAKTGSIKKVSPEFLVKAISRTQTSDQSSALVDAFKVRAINMSADDSFSAAKLILEMFKESSQFGTEYGRCLAALAPHLTLENIGNLVESLFLTQPLQAPPHIDLLWPAFEIFGPKLAPDTARLTVQVISNVLPDDSQLGNNSVNGRYSNLVRELMSVTPQLKPEDAAVLGDNLINRMKTTKHYDRLLFAGHLRVALQSLAPMMDSEHARMLAIESFDAMVDTRASQDWPSDVLPVFAPYLSSDETRRLGDRIVGLADQNHDPDALTSIAWAFNRIASQLTSEQVQTITTQMVDRVALFKHAEMMFILSATAPYLPADQAMQAERLILPEIQNDDSNRSGLTDTFVEIAGRLNETDAGALAYSIMDLLKTASEDQRGSYIKAFVSLTPRLKKGESRSLEVKLSNLLSSARNNGEFYDLDQGWAALLLQMNPNDSQQFKKQILAKFSDSYDYALLPVVEEFAPQLNEFEAAAAAKNILRVLDHTNLDTDDGLPPIENSFSAVVMRISDIEVNKLAQLMLDKVSNDEGSMERAALMRMFTKLTTRLSAEDARAFIEPFEAEMSNHIYSYGDHQTGEAEVLVGLSGRLTPPERLRLIVTLLKYPTAYGSSGETLIKALKQDFEVSGVNTAQSDPDLFNWLKGYPGIDLAIPPKRVVKTVHP